MECLSNNPHKCYDVFSTVVSPLLPIQHSPSMTIPMIIELHWSSYEYFLGTLHTFNIPKEKWNIVLNPEGKHFLQGRKDVITATKNGLFSIYYYRADSSCLPWLLDDPPFEEICISDSDSEDEGESHPPPSSS
jgi:hypothetical protein